MTDTYNNTLKFWNQVFEMSEEEKEQFLKERNPETDWKELAPSEKLREIDTEHLSGCKKVLDYGCGEGWAGIALNKSGCKDVTCVDVNTRAVALAKENAKLNLRAPDTIMVSDILEAVPADKMFDTVITNPPVRAGKKIVFAFYEQSYAHMKEGGAIYVVLQRKQGADSSKKKLTELFGNCETIDIKGGYHVMKSVKGGA